MGIRCLPSPSVAPRPPRQASRISWKGLPLRSSTGLVRRWTTRTPTATASSVDASQETTTWARKSLAGGDSSVWGALLHAVPYRAMPLAWMRIGAELFPARAASVRANVWPELTREDKISFRRDVVQGNGATAAPQRLTTTSTPSNARSSTVPRSGSQPNSLSAAGLRRTSRTTSSPSVASWFRSALPRNPDAPASNHFTCYRPPLESAGERQPTSPISCHFPALFVAGERTDAPNGLTVRTRAELRVRTRSRSRLPRVGP